MKLREIKEDHLCPICEGRLVYKNMPIRNEDIRYMVIPKAWYCNKCDKYFEEVNDETA